MSKIIPPSNGRIVWFTPGSDFPGRWIDIQKPLAAMICHVWGDRMVNLDVVDSNGFHWSATSVDLIQPGDEAATRGMGRFCEWMPYQVGQAAKTESLGANIHGIGPDTASGLNPYYRPPAQAPAHIKCKWRGIEFGDCTYPACRCKHVVEA